MDSSEYNLFSSINTNGVTVADTFNSWRKSTNSIIQKLTVEAGSPTWDTTGKVVIGAVVTNGNAATVDIGVARTGSGDAIINLGSVSGSNNVAINRASGANGTFTVTNNGTGLFTLSQAGAGDIRLLTSATERVRILSGGSVGIGTASPTELLHVNGGNFKVSGTINSAAITSSSTIGGTNITASGFLNSQTLNVGTASQFTVSNAGAIVGVSLNAGSGTIQTTGAITGGAITGTSLSGSSGTISTSGQIKSSGVALNSNQVNAGNSAAELALSYANYDDDTATYNTVIYNGTGTPAVTVNGSTKAVTFAGALSGITSLTASGAITGTSLISSGTISATGNASAAEPTSSTHLTTKGYVDGRTNAVLKFPEKLNGGKCNSYDSFVFVDSNNTLRGIGNLNGRFGNTDIQAPASFFGSTDAAYSVSKSYINDQNVFVLTTAGEVYASGTNANGQMGQGDTTGRVYLTKTLNIANCSKVAISPDTNAFTVYFLTTDGKVYATGNNQYGQIGNGTTTSISTPVLVLGPGNTYANPTTTVIDIENAGSYNGSTTPHTAIALLSDGTVWCVGYGGLGQMSNGSTTSINNKWVQVKTAVATNLTGISKIYSAGSDGYNTMYALSSSGILYGWGYNGWGQLGNGTTTLATYAITISGNVANFWVFGASCFIKKSTDNKLYGWGYNGYGQLGNGTTTNITSVTLVSTLSSVNVENMWGSADDTYVGMHVFLKLVGSNTLYACGYNAQGALGIGTTSDISTFTKVYFPPASTISDIMCMFNTNIGAYTMILTSDGNVYHSGQSRWGIGMRQDGNRTLFAKVTDITCG